MCVPRYYTRYKFQTGIFAGVIVSFGW
eukprot:SAG11_NODE_33319_length_278_cov_0.569832_1_plen_26_part_10